MPTYAFRCAKCRVEFDVSLSFSDSSKTVKCPSCSSKHVDRLYGSSLQSSMETIKSLDRPPSASCDGCNETSCEGCVR